MRTEILRVALYVIAAWFTLGTAYLTWLTTHLRSAGVLLLACFSAAVVAVLIAAAGDLR